MILSLFIALLVLAGGVGYAQPATHIIELEPLATGLTAPLGVTHAGDGSGRQFITEQSGQIRIVRDGEL
jgi:hypothetical protein